MIYCVQVCVYISMKTQNLVIISTTRYSMYVYLIYYICQGCIYLIYFLSNSNYYLKGEGKIIHQY